MIPPERVDGQNACGFFGDQWEYKRATRMSEILRSGIAINPGQWNDRHNVADDAMKPYGSSRSFSSVVPAYMRHGLLSHHPVRVFTHIKSNLTGQEFESGTMCQVHTDLKFRMSSRNRI